MSAASEQLIPFGWDDWFAAQAEARGLAGAHLARVVAVDREQLLVIDAAGEFRAKLAGRLLHSAGQPADFPCVGDWVSLLERSADRFGLIHEVLPRKTFLRRKAAGESVDYQMIAANLDVALLVQSCHFDFNVNRLERYLVMVREGRVEPLILLTKTDLVSPEELRQLIEKIRRAGIATEVIALSNLTGEGVNQLRDRLQAGKTYCLLGSSGVGKSTLLNQLLGRSRLETRAVSATGEGRHTTVRRELIVLEQGAMLIDNPGMREFGLLGAEEGLGESFAEIYALAAQCKFGDCSHANEPGCAVLGAIEAGQLDAAHYQNFLKLRGEAEFHELSALEKRKKDQAFGRYLKTAKKDPGITRKS